MRMISFVSALMALSMPFAVMADDKEKPGESSQAVKVERGTGPQTYPGVRQQQGRVLTDDDLNDSEARKLPGQRKYGNITLKRGVISSDAAMAQRRALARLKAPVKTAGMRPAEAAYLRELRDWALAQEKVLLELQQLHSAFARLKQERDLAAARSRDTSNIDLRLKSMKDRMESLSELSRNNEMRLRQYQQKQQERIRQMSEATRKQSETVKAIVGNMK